MPRIFVPSIVLRGLAGKTHTQEQMANDANKQVRLSPQRPFVAHVRFSQRYRNFLPDNIDIMAGPAVLQAKVKSVMSGDTVTLAHPNDPRKERVLSLAFVTSPRLRREEDEVYSMYRIWMTLG